MSVRSRSSSSSRKRPDSQYESGELDPPNTAGASLLSKRMCNQSSKERREIRHRYRELIHETIQQDEDEQDIGNLTEKLTEADKLFKKEVHMTREGALDSKLLSQITTRGMHKVRHLSTDVVTFHAGDFAERLVQHISGDDQIVENWSAVGKLVSFFFRRSPAFHFMKGSYEPGAAPPPKKKVAARTQRSKELEDKREAPEKVAVVKKSDEEATAEEVEALLGLLRHYCSENNDEPMCFFEFVVDPDSYTQTILNIFHLSFLIKDGYVQLYYDSDGLPIIEPIQREDPSARSTVKNEVVLSITKQEWQEIIEAFVITDALIKPGAVKRL